LSAKELPRSARFSSAYAEWLAARAAFCAIDGDQSDEAMTKLAEREREAQLALIASPAVRAGQIWQKWELAET